MLRNAPLWPTLGESELIPGNINGTDNDDHLLHSQVNFFIPASTSIKASIHLIQQELARRSKIQAQCAARSSVIQLILDNLDTAMVSILQPLQRREGICKLAADL